MSHHFLVLGAVALVCCAPSVNAQEGGAPLEMLYKQPAELWL